MVEYEILMVKSPIGVSTKLNLVEIPIGISTGRNLLDFLPVELEFTIDISIKDWSESKICRWRGHQCKTILITGFKEKDAL